MESNYKKIRNILIISAIAGVFLLVVVIIFYYWHFNGDLLYEHDKWGQVGDFFGGILNPIYSLLAYLGLLSTLALTYKSSLAIHAENKRQCHVDRREEAYKIISSISSKIDSHLERRIKVSDRHDSFREKQVVFTEFLITSYIEDEGWQVAETNQAFINKLTAMIEFLTISLLKYRDLDTLEYIPNYYKALYGDVVNFLEKYYKVSDEVVDYFKPDKA